MKLNLHQPHKRYILILLLLVVVFLPVPFRHKGMTKLNITGLDGAKITTDAYALTADHKLMVDKDIAERILDARIGWEKEAPLPKGVYYKDHVAVLMYHHLTETPLMLYPGVLPAVQFDEQMQLLKQEGFHVITMKQYREFMLDRAPVPDNAVLLTFDDGYESFYKLAFSHSAKVRLHRSELHHCLRCGQH
ncbi:hypothetical protein ACFTAO_45400 [Paenibacillus rhizoplanae]